MFEDYEDLDQGQLIPQVLTQCGTEPVKKTFMHILRKQFGFMIF